MNTIRRFFFKLHAGTLVHRKFQSLEIPIRCKHRHYILHLLRQNRRKGPAKYLIESGVAKWGKGGGGGGGGMCESGIENSTCSEHL